jgi:hypothetical protein
LTPKHEFEQVGRRDLTARVRQGVEDIPEVVLEEEMAEHLEAGHQGLTPTRRGERNDHYQRNLLTPVGNMERLKAPADREVANVLHLMVCRAASWCAENVLERCWSWGYAIAQCKNEVRPT